MDPLLEDISIKLETLSQAVLNSWTDNRTLAEAFGWNHPCLTRHDLAEIPKKLSEKIRNANIDSLEQAQIDSIVNIPHRLLVVQTSNLPYFYNGNGVHAIPAYISTLSWVNSLIEPIVDWQIVNDNRYLPAAIYRKLTIVDSQLSDIVNKKEALQNHIKIIEDAKETAEALPIDLKNLKDTRAEIANIFNEVSQSHNAIVTADNNCKDLLDKISGNKRQTDGLVEKCEEAYSITTTKGLAGAFEKRANSLNSSMWGWVILLFFTLLVGAYISSENLKQLTSLYGRKDVTGLHIFIQFTISLLGVGGPIWFAWIATKQITQRFRLSEDYAFKSSVAKAYEGYRKEATRIDEAFEARLFGSALTRLEEAPLRLVDIETYGSPWHEFFGSKAFREALNSVPDLKSQYISVMKKTNSDGTTQEIAKIESNPN